MTGSIIIPCPMCKSMVEINGLFISYSGQKEWILRRVSVSSPRSQGLASGKCPNCSSTVKIDEGRLEAVIRR